MKHSTAGNASRRDARAPRINTDGPRVGVVLVGITQTAKVLGRGETPVQNRFGGCASDDGAAAILAAKEMIAERFSRVMGIALEAVKIAL